ncbi:Csmd1 [Scenedesmus sp. PABB004]|nr:Csmd1 [Scenedesmus sp. PABB004]
MARGGALVLVVLLALAAGAAGQNATRCGLNARLKDGRCLCVRPFTRVPRTGDCCLANQYVAGSGAQRRCACRRGYVFSAATQKCRAAAASASAPEVFALPAAVHADAAAAAAACRNASGGAALATLAQLTAARAAGADWCDWGYVMATSDGADGGAPLAAFPGGKCATDRGEAAGVQTRAAPDALVGAVCFGIKPFEGTAGVAPFSAAAWTQWVCMYAGLPPAPGGSAWPTTCSYTAVGGVCAGVCGGRGAGLFYSMCIGGSWAPPVGDCKVTYCPGNPPNPPSGKFECAASASVGTTCNATCSDGGAASAACQADGTWGPIMGACKIACFARDLPAAPANGVWLAADCAEVAPGGSCKAQCAPGTEGAPTISCGADGTWQASSGACTPSTVACTGSPPALTNGVFNCGASTPHGSNCTAACNPSFFGEPAGAPLAVCRNGKWDAVVGQCLAGCSGAQLPAAPANAQWEACPNAGTGGVCRAKCAADYAGAPAAVCTGPGTGWAVAGTCVAAPLSCSGSPPDPANGAFDCGPFTVRNAACNATCRPGFAGAPTATCGADGKWGAVTGVCTASTTVCAGSPPNPAGGAFDCGASSAVSSLCSAACAAGYVFDALGSPAGATGPWARCGASGQWGRVSGACVARQTSCSGSPERYPFLGRITNGAFACSATPVGSACAADCDDTYVGAPAARCERGGLWGPVVGACAPGCDASGLPPAPRNAAWAASCSGAGGVRTGSVCSAVCGSGFVGAPVAACAGANNGPGGAMMTLAASSPADDAAAPPEDGGASPLLRALAALDDGVWAEALLPKLREDTGSASAFALACREARRLVQSSAASLSLRAADCTRAAPLARLGQRFTGCSEVAFALTSPGDTGAPLATLLPALARLPRLTSLRLDAAASAAASEPAAIAPAIAAAAAQLPGLRSLDLALGRSWEGSDAAWRALGLATQLTRVAVRFDALLSPVTLRHLSALTAISGLASLDVGVGTLRGAQQYGFLAGLPAALTQLTLPLACDHQGLDAVGACTGLQSLTFEVHPSSDYSDDRVWPTLGEAACASLARCTRLTALDVFVEQSSDPHLLAALAALTGLQGLCIDHLSRASLPCLASLSQLTYLQGSWVEGAGGGAGRASAACPSLVELCGRGPVLFEASPRLRRVVQIGAWPTATLRGLAAHCSGLTALVVCGCGHWAGPSFEAGTGAQVECVAALRTLAGLKELRVLGLSASDDAEVAALAAATQAWLRALRFADKVRVSVTDEGQRAAWAIAAAAVAAHAPGTARPDWFVVKVVRPVQAPPANGVWSGSEDEWE